MRAIELAFAGAEALVNIAPVSARLKSCPVTKHAQDAAMASFSQPVKPPDPSEIIDLQL
jgi:hypothetical protein